MDGIEFNINQSVKVKLTDYGRKILANQWNAYAIEYPAVFEIRTPDDYKNNEDEEGYTTFQLWTLMEHFGSHIGMTKESPFDTNIIINLWESI